MRILTAFLSGVAAIAIVEAPAQAQTNPETESSNTSGQLQEIIVTAQKRAENLQNVPIAITAVSSEALEARGITSTADVGQVTPGLTFTAVAGTAAPRIRGIGSGTALAGNENAVATYIDGVYFASSGSSILSLNNIEQVAVLKGPQGTLFGRNATGGLIQITTRDPSQDFGGSASVLYGNKNTVGGSLYMTGGLTAGLAGDLAVFYQNQMDGFGKNLTTGSDVNKPKDFAIRTKWKAQLGPTTTARLAVDYALHQDVTPAQRPMYGSIPANGTPYTGSVFDISSNVDPYYKNRQGGVSLTVNQDLSNVELVSITAYRRAKTLINIDIDATQTPILAAFLGMKDHQFSQELQLVSHNDGPFSWTVGAYYFKARGGFDDTTIEFPGGRQFYTAVQRIESAAGFVQGTYKLTDTTSLTGGFRYTWEKHKYNAAGTVFITGGPTLPSAPVSDATTVKKPTWRIALDQRLNDNVLIYASYNRGFKSGGYNGVVFDAVQKYDPEVLDAYEAGIKADMLNRTVRLNMAAYYYDYKSLQLTSFVNGVPSLYNANARIYGMDVDLTVIPTPRLTLTGGLALIHDRFKSGSIVLINSPAPGGGNINSSGDVAGNRVPMTPDWTVSLGADYAVPLPSGSLHFAAQYFHSDGWMAEPDNRLVQKPYNILDGSIQWRIGSSEKFSIRLWGKNLTNTAYAAQIASDQVKDGISLMPGRTFGATLGVDF